jgi:hypothetical protein
MSESPIIEDINKTENLVADCTVRNVVIVLVVMLLLYTFIEPSSITGGYTPSYIPCKKQVKKVKFRCL